MMYAYIRPLQIHAVIDRKKDRSRSVRPFHPSVVCPSVHHKGGQSVHLSVRHKFTRRSTEKKTALALSVRPSSVRPTVTRVCSPSVCPSVTNSCSDRQKKKTALALSVRPSSVRPSIRHKGGHSSSVRSIHPSQIHAVIDRKG